MALRQRKTKDPVLPLYNNLSIVGSHNNDDDESTNKRGRPAAPTPVSLPLPRTLSKGSNSLYTVYIPLIAFFVIAFGLAYVVIGGGGGVDGDGGDLSQRHHHRPVLLRPNKHYHQHTAGRMKEELGPSSINLKKKQQPDSLHRGLDIVSPNNSIIQKRSSRHEEHTTQIKI
jgi:hypothetical protein